jgi:beta-galactosidase
VGRLAVVSLSQRRVEIPLGHRPRNAARFLEDGLRRPRWTTIPVPSNWESRATDPDLLNITYPHVKDPPHIMEDPPANYTAFRERNPVGSYRRTFALPPTGRAPRVPDLRRRRLGLYLWVNGTQIGYSQDSRTPRSST